MSQSARTERIAAVSDALSLTDSLALLGAGGTHDKLGPRIILQIFLRTFPFIRSVRAHIACFLVIVLTGIVTLIPVALLLQNALWEGVLYGRPVSGWAAAIFGVSPADFLTGGEAALTATRQVLRTRVMIAVGLLAVVAAPLVAAVYYYMVWILQRINQLLRVRMLEHFQALSLRVHSDARVGDSIYRVYQDSAMVTNVIQTIFLQPVIHGMGLLVGIVCVALFSPKLALAVAGVLVPAIALGLWLSTRLRRYFRGAREANSDLTSRIQETLEGVRVIKAYGAERAEQVRFETESAAAFQKAYRARLLFATFAVAIFWLAAAGLLFVALESATRTLEGAATFATRVLQSFGLSVFTIAAYQSVMFVAGLGTSSIESLFTLWAKMQDIAIGLDRVFELLDVTPEIRDRADAVPLEGVREAITFQDVRFAYARGVPIVRDVSFRARVGTVTAIVGPTGAGKSTLMSLLLRLYDPDEGSIAIDGIDLRDLTVESLRGKVAIALQENVLFATSVRENIRYGHTSAPDSAVREAARIACADEFITELPGGYDTLLGERGTKLSTGQRQRLSIARAILKDTPILILDEPTASLDAETELRVMENLARWGAGRAVFIVTHRLSTIRHADHVVYLQGGRVLEQGAPGALIARRGGAFRELVELDSGAAAVVEASA